MLHSCYMMPPFRKFLLCALFIAAPLVLSCRSGNSDETITNLHAADVPVRALVRPQVDPTAAFPETFPMQVAVYWTNPKPGILGLQHALLEMGVPFFVTRDFDQALRHHLVVLAEPLPPFTPDQIQKLTNLVNGGGSVVAVQSEAANLGPLFGFRAAIPTRSHHKVIFVPNQDPVEAYLNRPEELEAPLGAANYNDIFWTHSYTPSTATVLARFEDGTAGVLRNKSGAGTAYTIGLGFHDIVLRNQNNRDLEAERHYANAFEPGADIWMLLLRAWYESSQPGAVRLGTIPDGKNSVLMISHDVDWENSFAPMLDFAAMEDRHHVKSNFFIQTRYVSDTNSKAFFSGKNVEDLKQVQSLGFPIGSHSVIHSAAFNKFDLGSGNESYDNYRPKATGFDSAVNATVFGEVRVSKQLIDGALPGHNTEFFRAGHLRVPPYLPEALQRTGYEFDSSFTAGDVLTNFPYALTFDLGFFDDSGLYEFPVTFEDEEKPSLEQRVDRALEVIRANAENGAVNVILIHTNEAKKKLEAEEALLNQLPSDVSVVSMSSFAHFWRARDRLKWSIAPGKTANSFSLTATSTEAVEGLTFEFQRPVASVDGCAKLLENKQRIVLPALKAGESASFNIRYGN